MSELSPARPRRKKYIRRSQLVTCTCGYVGLPGHRNSARHQISALHVHAQGLRDLLATDGITFREIGDRLGITRERVRQIAQRLGYTSGHARQKRQRLARLAERKEKWDLLRALRADCPYAIDSMAPGLRFREVQILGITCQLARASLRRRNGYTHLSGLTGDTGTKVALVKLPQGGWMVMPRERCRPLDTKLGERKRQGADRHHHDYNQMVNNWKLLEEMKAADAAAA